MNFADAIPWRVRLRRVYRVNDVVLTRTGKQRSPGEIYVAAWRVTRYPPEAHGCILVCFNIIGIGFNLPRIYVAVILRPLEWIPIAGTARPIVDHLLNSCGRVICRLILRPADRIDDDRLGPTAGLTRHDADHRNIPDALSYEPVDLKILVLS